ncbi:MAG: DNA-binding protein [Planctomycetaceae bacterium]|nr:DNA-binding protein [Planctomycetaceae bacterium]
MQITLDRDDLRAIVTEVLAEVMAQTSTTPHQQLLTEPEAAAVVRVQAHTLRDARRRGELQFHRVGRFVRYDRAQLDQWIKRGPAPK